MSNPPGHVITEPLLGTPGNTFTPPPLNSQPKELPRLAPTLLPPAPSPNLRLAGDRDSPAADISVSLQATTLQPPPVRRETAPLPDWTAQMDQLRNDVFGIAMSVSALKDRLDRLEQKVSSGDQSTQTTLTQLRGEVGAWLETHLNAAVEHCMQHIFSRTNPPASLPAT